MNNKKYVISIVICVLIAATWVLMTVAIIESIVFNIPVDLNTGILDYAFAICTTIAYAVMSVVTYSYAIALFYEIRYEKQRRRRAKRNGRKLARHIERAMHVAEQRINGD